MTEPTETKTPLDAAFEDHTPVSEEENFSTKMTEIFGQPTVPLSTAVGIFALAFLTTPFIFLVDFLHLIERCLVKTPAAIAEFALRLYFGEPAYSKRKKLYFRKLRKLARL